MSLTPVTRVRGYCWPLTNRVSLFSPVGTREELIHAVKSCADVIHKHTISFFAQWGPLCSQRRYIIVCYWHVRHVMIVTLDTQIGLRLFYSTCSDVQ